MPQNSLHILVVDDDSDLRTTLCAELSNEGYSVTAAANGKEAVSLIEGKRFDVIILDIRMPALDGFTVLRFIKRTFPQTKVIMLTGYADLMNVTKCRKLGADDVVEKPYDLGDLFDSIRFVMHRKQQ